jgi:hypothetical protein
MAAVSRIILLLGVFAFVPAALGAYTDPYLEKTLKTAMVKTFHKQAPKLTFGSVKCVLPKNGVTAHCKAYFTVSSTKGYYPVKATIHDSGQLSWTASSPQCWNPAKKRYAAC